MKLLITLAAAAAAAGLSGCVAYPAGGYYGNGYYSNGYAGGYYGGAVIETRPYYYGGYRPRDRDSDGVPNWRDRAPNNPYRY